MSPNSLAARAGVQATTGGVVGDRPIQPRYRLTPPPCRTPPGRRPHPPRIGRHALAARVNSVARPRPACFPRDDPATRRSTMTAAFMSTHSTYLEDMTHRG